MPQRPLWLRGERALGRLDETRLRLYKMVQLKRLRAHTELIHTGDDHSPLVFLSLDQSFLGTRFQEYSQGLGSRVLNVHRGARGFYELGRTIWQDVRFVEDQRGDWEGPGRQFR